MKQRDTDLLSGAEQRRVQGRQRSERKTRKGQRRRRAGGQRLESRAKGGGRRRRRNQSGRARMGVADQGPAVRRHQAVADGDADTCHDTRHLFVFDSSGGAAPSTCDAEPDRRPTQTSLGHFHQISLNLGLKLLFIGQSRDLMWQGHLAVDPSDTGQWTGPVSTRRRRAGRRRRDHLQQVPSARKLRVP